MIYALIITHGNLGAELMRVIESVLGSQEAVHVLSNDKKDLDGLCEMVASQIPPHEDAVLFVDFCGGSPYVACRRNCENVGRVTVITGVNLPMLISFFTKRSSLDIAKLIQAVQEDGLRGIQRFPQESST